MKKSDKTYDRNRGTDGASTSFFKKISYLADDCSIFSNEKEHSSTTKKVNQKNSKNERYTCFARQHQSVKNFYRRNSNAISSHVKSSNSRVCESAKNHNLRYTLFSSISKNGLALWSKLLQIINQRSYHSGGSDAICILCC